MIGIPCHFRPTNANISACGVEAPALAAYDGRDVNCLRCRKTVAWRKYMGLMRPGAMFEKAIVVVRGHRIRCVILKGLCARCGKNRAVVYDNGGDICQHCYNAEFK